MKIRSYIHGMKLQVTKAQNVDQMGLTGKNERGSDPCNLKMQSYIHGIRKERKSIQMSNNTIQNNMNNVHFKPEGALKGLNVQYSVKAQLGRPVDPNSARQKRLATAPGKRTGRPINPNSARQQRLAEQAARAALNGGVAKRGRPVNPNSARQIALREAVAKAVAQPITNAVIMEDDISAPTRVNGVDVAQHGVDRGATEFTKGLI